MGPTTAPLFTALTTVAAGMLMLLSGVKKRKLVWRKRPPHRPVRIRRPRA